MRANGGEGINFARMRTTTDAVGFDPSACDTVLCVRSLESDIEGFLIFFAASSAITTEAGTRTRPDMPPLPLMPQPQFTSV